MSGPSIHGPTHEIFEHVDGSFESVGTDIVPGLADALNALRKAPLIYAQGENVAYASSLEPSAPIIPIANFAQNGVDVSTSNEWIIETAGLYVLRAHFESVTPSTTPATGETVTVQAGVLADPTDLLKCISALGMLVDGVKAPYHLAALLTLEVADIIQITGFSSAGTDIQTQNAQFSLVKAD